MDWSVLQFASAPPDSHVLLHCQHSSMLIVFAVAVACAASYAALSLAERISNTATTTSRHAWTAVGSLCLGGGIWAMHFIAMLAFQAPVAVRYAPGITLLSLLLAVAASFLALQVIGRSGARHPHYLLGALIVGLGISAMHYTGMSAMESAATLYYRPGFFGLSVLIAIAASGSAILLASSLRNQQGRTVLLSRLFASLIMGGAISSMHFTGMQALLMVVPEGTPLHLQNTTEALHLGSMIGLITLLVIGSALIASYADRKIQTKEQDISRMNLLLNQLDRAHDSLQQLANYDPLTNLFNRRAFGEQFTRRLKENLRNHSSFAVLFLDLDHFKRINDTLGHDAGDELLKIIARRLRSLLREQDVIARFGGDEFCVLSPVAERPEALAIARRIMQNLKEPVELSGRTVVMSTSIGICLYPDDGSNSDELLKHADLALYQAKASGRNKLHVFNSQLKQQAALELQLEEDLRQAIESDGLCLQYQPVVDVASGSVVKLEALVRWQHPQHGMLTPDRFIPLAELNGFINKLDGWVLRRACRDLKLLHLGGHAQLRVAVNCSALNLGHESLPERIEDILREEALSADFIELEVTENALMGNISKAAAILARIRDLDIGLSIDDFGTGYSSLAYLKSLPIHTLKIDRSFITDIPGSVNDMEITAAIIAMAHKLKLHVVAEGIETAEQAAFLKENQCDMLQGFFISQPLALPELMTFLTRQRQDRSEPLKTV